MSYWGPYLITHGSFILFGFFGNWLEVIPYSKTDFGTLGISLRNLVHPILELTWHLSPFSWSISAFGDPRKMIGGCSPPRNELWHLWYTLYKIWYIQLLSYQNLYFLTHSSFIFLGIFGKWLKVVSYFEMDFKTLGTFFKNFDTSNHCANWTPVSIPIVHFFLWRSLGSDRRSFPTSERTLATLVYTLQNLVHSLQNLVHLSQNLVYP